MATKIELEFQMKFLVTQIEFYDWYVGEIKSSKINANSYIKKMKSKIKSFEYFLNEKSFPLDWDRHCKIYKIKSDRINNDISTFSLNVDTVHYTHNQYLRSRAEIKSNLKELSHWTEIWGQIKSALEDEYPAVTDKRKVEEINILKRKVNKLLEDLGKMNPKYELEEAQKTKGDIGNELTTRRGEPSKYHDDLYYRLSEVYYTVWGEGISFKNLCLTIAEEKGLVRGVELIGAKIKKVQEEFEKRGYKARFQSIRKILNESKYKEN